MDSAHGKLTWGWLELLVRGVNQREGQLADLEPIDWCIYLMDNPPCSCARLQLDLK